MKTVEHNLRPEVRDQQGFAVHVLRNEKVELAVVPELGARIISLRNLRSGREWMWHPPGGLKLFRNRLGDNFCTSPLVGMDECLPTITACPWKGRQLPDHGEVWTAAWTVDEPAWRSGLLLTRTRLQISPLEFERTIELCDDEIRFAYRLTNLGSDNEQYVWAMHPLMRFQAGDQVLLPASTRARLNGEAWLDAVDSAMPEGQCAKVFARPVTVGSAEVYNGRTGDYLEFEWDPVENDTLGLWLTRGGWHGHHHLALEPTNGADDSLALAAKEGSCGAIGPGGVVTWDVLFRVGHATDAVVGQGASAADCLTSGDCDRCNEV